MIRNRCIKWTIASACLSLGLVNPLTSQPTYWVKASGFLPGKVNSIVVTNGGDLFAALSHAPSLFQSTDGGDHWNEVTSFPQSNDPVSLAESPDGVLFATSTSGGTRRSTDGGLSWTSIFPGMFSIAVGLDGTLYLGSGAIYHSSDQGSSFQRSGPSGPTATNVLAAADSHTVYGGEVYMYSQGGGFPRPYGVLIRYDNSGYAWTEVLNRGTSFPTLQSITTLPGGYVLANVYQLIVRSTDGGATWSDLPQPQPLWNIYAFASAPPAQVFATTADSSFFRSTDFGLTWIEEKGGLGGARLGPLAISHDGFLFAGSDSAVFRTTLPIVGIVEAEHIVTEFTLGQNYPNPFNPTTTVKYDLRMTAQVDLVVYDVLGREVEILVREQKDAGSHTVEFDGKGLANGVYLYRLTAGDYVQTRKMLMLR